jgi:hypothetical protein
VAEIKFVDKGVLCQAPHMEYPNELEDAMPVE